MLPPLLMFFTIVFRHIPPSIATRYLGCCCPLLRFAATVCSVRLLRLLMTYVTVARLSLNASLPLRYPMSVRCCLNIQRAKTSR